MNRVSTRFFRKLVKIHYYYLFCFIMDKHLFLATVHMYIYNFKIFLGNSLMKARDVWEDVQQCSITAQSHVNLRLRHEYLKMRLHKAAFCQHCFHKRISYVIVQWINIWVIFSIKWHNHASVKETFYSLNQSAPKWSSIFSNLGTYL